MESKEIEEFFDTCLDAFTKALDERFSQRIDREANTGDTEADHLHADEIMGELCRAMNLDKTAEAFEAVNKWYA